MCRIVPINSLLLKISRRTKLSSSSLIYWGAPSESKLCLPGTSKFSKFVKIQFAFLYFEFICLKLAIYFVSKTQKRNRVTSQTVIFWALVSLHKKLNPSCKNGMSSNLELHKPYFAQFDVIKYELLQTFTLYEVLLATLPLDLTKSSTLIGLKGTIYQLNTNFFLWLIAVLTSLLH